MIFYFIKIQIDIKFTIQLRFTTAEKQKQQLVINDHIISKYLLQTNDENYWKVVEHFSLIDKRFIK